ncbi:hypothetical protein H6503_01935 [Candidatus Woesearchaeota archaeon]|nr:hypothetical protein [Candidatus Woesearchaeota archaeon]
MAKKEGRSAGELEERRIVSPLSSSFMLTSIVGFLTSAFYLPTMVDVWPSAIDYAFAFGLVFVLMFIASLISMTYSPLSDHLQIDEKRRIKL